MIIIKIMRRIGFALLCVLCGFALKKLNQPSPNQERLWIGGAGHEVFVEGYG